MAWVVKLGRQQKKLRISIPNQLVKTMGLRDDQYVSIHQKSSKAFLVMLVDEPKAPQIPKLPTARRMS